MPKVLEKISNIFSRNKSHLETDAVPVPDSTEGEDQQVQPIDSPVNSLALSSCPDNLALIERNGNQAAPSVELYNSNTFHATNTYTQGQVFYQISHVNGLHMGSVFNINTGKDSSNKNQKRAKTKTIVEMMRSEEQLTHKMLDCISTHLGEGWQMIMRELNFSDGQIHQAKVDYNVDGGLKEVIYQLLLDWSRNDDNATLGHITKLLWKSGHTETVKYMKETWKAEKNVKPSEDTT